MELLVDVAQLMKMVIPSMAAIQRPNATRAGQRGIPMMKCATSKITPGSAQNALKMRFNPKHSRKPPSTPGLFMLLTPFPVVLL